MSTEEALAKGDAALDAGRWLDARDAYETALRESGSPRALACLGDALFFLGNTLESVQLRERAYATFRRAGDRAKAADSAIWLCLVYQSCMGNRAAARGWLARAESLLRDFEAPLLRAWVHYCGALFSDPESGRALIERALASARSIGDVDLELCALAELGVVLVKAGETETGLKCVDEAMAGALSGEGSTAYTVVMTSCSMMTICDLLCDLDRVRQWSSAADEFTRTYGCPYLYAECRIAHGRVLVVTGRWTEAEDELRTAITATRAAFGGLHHRAVASLAELRVCQGRVDDANALVESIDAPVATALVRAALALRTNDPASAVALVQRWLDSDADPVAPPMHAGGRGISIEHANAYLLLVDAHIAGANQDAAADASRRLTDLAERSSAGYPMALAAVGRGLIASATGQVDQSVQCFQDALHRFSVLALPLEAGRARLELARAWFPQQPALAIAEARSALLALDRLGAATEADLAAALLRSWGSPGRSVPQVSGSLTRREQEIVALVSAGRSNGEIAEKLYISRKTVAHHISNILMKLGVRNRSEAAAVAVRLGLASNEETTG